MQDPNQPSQLQKLAKELKILHYASGAILLYTDKLKMCKLDCLSLRFDTPLGNLRKLMHERPCLIHIFNYIL